MSVIWFTGSISGFSITVGLNQSQLSITVAAPDDYLNQTMGLLGVFNKDPSDDLTPASGTALNVSTATEKTIFYQFGETCKTFLEPRTKDEHTIQYNTIQYNTIQYNTIQYNTIQYNTIQYNTIQYNFLHSYKSNNTVVWTTSTVTEKKITQQLT